MSKLADQFLADASRWWSTGIIEIQPDHIYLRGRPVQSLIGNASFVATIWLMLRGDLPGATQEKLLTAALVASVDHGPHAPSIAIARMAATCGVGVNNAMASGINALGDVHGGAGQQCLALYERVCADGTCLGAAAERAVAEAIAAKRHLPGFGHRFHTVDPRTAPLLDLVRNAIDEGSVPGRHLEAGLAVGRALEAAKGRPLPMNVDGVTAIVFGELGFSPVEARGLFILSRSVGILAHANEQMRQGGRIKGPMPPTIPYFYEGVDAERLAGNLP